jgi:hypothetical protein
MEDQLKLPNANLAVIDKKKVVEYLLNREHPDNGGKADFFLGMGFYENDWEEFRSALRLLAVSASVTSTMESSHGKKYIVDGPINRPNGIERLVRSVWIVDAGETVPRLVTAYPLEGKGDD